MVECSFMNQVVVGSNPVAVTKVSDIAPVLSKKFLDIQPTSECWFTLKQVGTRMGASELRFDFIYS